MAVVYIITFVKGEKRFRYVGETRDFNERIKIHLNLLEKGTHHNFTLQKIWNEGYRYDGNPTIVPCSSKTKARELEQKMISSEKGFVNIECGYDCISRNPRRAEIIQKMTNSLYRRFSKMTKEERQKIYGKFGKANGMYGRTHTPEARKKIREKLAEWYKHNTSPCLGMKRSEETRRKLSIIAAQRVGEKNPFYGKHHSDETKRKLAERRMGIKPTNSRPVNIDGIEYESITEAGRQLGKNKTVVLWRVNSKNPKYSTWKWSDKCPETRT